MNMNTPFWDTFFRLWMTVSVLLCALWVLNEFTLQL